MKKCFIWKELSDKGTLEDVEIYSSKRAVDRLNPQYDGFETEDEAINAFEEFKKSHEWTAPHKLVLVTIYVYED